MYKKTNGLPTIIKEVSTKKKLRYYNPNTIRKQCGHNGPIIRASNRCLMCAEMPVYDFLIDVQKQLTALPPYERSKARHLNQWSISSIRANSRIDRLRDAMRTIVEPTGYPEEHRFVYQIYVDDVKVIMDLNGRGYSTGEAAEKAMHKFLRKHDNARMFGADLISNRLARESLRTPVAL